MSAALALLFGNWKQIGALLLLAMVVGVYARFQWLEGQHKTDQAALAHANQMRIAAESQAALYRSAMNEAQHSARVNSVSAHNVAAAQMEIDHAPDAHSLYAAWVAGVDSVRNDAEPAFA